MSLGDRGSLGWSRFPESIRTIANNDVSRIENTSRQNDLG
jgi:hypothetical protein